MVIVRAQELGVGSQSEACLVTLELLSYGKIESEWGAKALPLVCVRGGAWLASHVLRGDLQALAKLESDLKAMSGAWTESVRVSWR